MLLTSKSSVCKSDGSLKVWHITSGISNGSEPNTSTIIDAVSGFNNLTSLADVHFFVSSLAAQYGFQCVSTFTYIPSLPHSHAVYLSGSEWNLVRYYRENACFKNDANLRYIKSQRSPFSWDPVYYRKTLASSLTADEKFVISTVMDHGVTQLACMPFHGATGDRGAFRFLRLGTKPLNPKQMVRFFQQTFYFYHLFYEQQLKLLRKELNLDQEPLLSDRELCVLNLYATGENPPKIADRLAISQQTVQQHLRNIRNKLGVRSTVHAVTKAGAQGLLSDC